MSTTLTDLITMVRNRTDTVSSQFVTDAEITSYLNASLAELDDLLVTTYEDFKVTNVAKTITGTTSTTASFTLPTDFYKCRGVDRDLGGRWGTLKPFNFQQRNAGAGAGFALAQLGCAELQYRIVGMTCEVMPYANAAGSYLLWYVPLFVPLTSGASSLAPYMDAQSWSEYAVADVGAKIQQKQELDPSIFLAQKQSLGQRIINAAKTRDAGGPKRIVDTRRSRGRRGYGWGMR